MTLAARVYCNLIGSNCARKSHLRLGRLPWSSAYERRLMFWRSWVRILALYTGWTFSAFVCCKKIKGCLKRPKINEIEAGDGPFKKIICVYQADADAQAEQAADGRQERDPGLPRLAVELENGRVFKVHLQRTFDR